MTKTRASKVAAPAILTQAQLETLGVSDTPPATQEPDGSTGEEVSPENDVGDNQPSHEMVPDNAPEAPPATPVNVLYVDSPIKKALFDLVLRAEFTKPAGKFAGKAMANLAKPWIDVQVEVVSEEHPVTGRTFQAAKGNWNFNDSNYVNPPETFKLLMEVATQANGGVSIPKKQLVGHLEDLKLICQKMAA